LQIDLCNLTINELQNRVSFFVAKKLPRGCKIPEQMNEIIQYAVPLAILYCAFRVGFATGEKAQIL